MLWKYRNQPAKGLYLTAQISSTLACLPIWCLLGLFSFGRQKKSWSFGRSLILRLLRTLLNITYTVGPLKHTPDFRAITDGPGIKASWVPPVQNLLFGTVKDAAEQNGVESVRIPGYWLDKPGHDAPIESKPSQGEKVAYHIHGGGFISLSAHPSDTPANICKGILKHCDNVKRTFSIEYRLSKAYPYPTQGAFPSALIDALSGYVHLINIGYDPKDIVLVGDSAGGNIALSLVRYLVEYASDASPSGSKLPPVPGALILLSPWSDVGDSHLFEGSDISNRRYDYITGSKDSHAYTRTALCGALGSGAVNTSRYLSPSSRFIEKVSFEGFPRTFVAVGGLEMLFDQLNTLNERMVRDIGNDVTRGVTYHMKPEAVHDWLLFAWHEPERTQTLQQIAAWMSQ